jgi:hypothetical protein
MAGAFLLTARDSPNAVLFRTGSYEEVDPAGLGATWLEEKK